MRNHSHRMEGKIQTRMELPLDVIIYTKMAWNGKRQLQSASESLLNTLSSLRALWCACNTPSKMPLLRV